MPQAGGVAVVFAVELPSRDVVVGPHVDLVSVREFQVQISGVIPSDIRARRSGEIEQRSLLDCWIVGVNGNNLDRRAGGSRQGQGYRCRDDEFVVVLEGQ